MDFKINKLKIHICEWLYAAWENVSDRIIMVLKVGSILDCYVHLTKYFRSKLCWTIKKHDY